MAESKFKEIAEMFGLKLEEVFEIKDEPDTFYKFTSKGLVSKVNGYDRWCPEGVALLGLLAGTLEVLRPPFKPQTGDLYWSYIYSGWVVAASDWIDDAVDHARLEAGMVFRTQEEALAARAELYKKVTGKEYNSNDYR